MIYHNGNMHARCQSTECNVGYGLYLVHVAGAALLGRQICARVELGTWATGTVQRHV